MMNSKKKQSPERKYFLRSRKDISEIENERLRMHALSFEIGMRKRTKWKRPRQRSCKYIPQCQKSLKKEMTGNSSSPTSTLLPEADLDIPQVITGDLSPACPVSGSELQEETPFITSHAGPICEETTAGNRGVRNKLQEIADHPKIVCEAKSLNDDFTIRKVKISDASTSERSKTYFKTDEIGPSQPSLEQSLKPIVSILKESLSLEAATPTLRTKYCDKNKWHLNRVKALDLQTPKRNTISSVIVKSPVINSDTAVPRTPKLLNQFCRPESSLLLKTPRTPRNSALPNLSGLTPLLGSLPPGCADNLSLSQNDRFLSTPKVPSTPNFYKLASTPLSLSQISNISEEYIPLTPCIKALQRFQGPIENTFRVSQLEVGAPDLIQLIDDEAVCAEAIDRDVSQYNRAAAVTDQNVADFIFDLTENPRIEDQWHNTTSLLPSAKKFKPQPHGQGRHCKRMTSELERAVREEQKQINKIKRMEKKKRFSQTPSEDPATLTLKAKRCGRKSRGLIKALQDSGVIHDNTDLDRIFARDSDSD